MDFFTQYKRPFDERKQLIVEYGEKNSGKEIVETAGYISPEDRIKAIIMAGERLEKWREEMYHYGDEKEDDGEYIDPSIEPGLDRMDMEDLNRHAMNVLITSAHRTSAKAAETESETDKSSGQAEGEADVESVKT